MSTVDPSTIGLKASETSATARLWNGVGAAVTAVRGLAFWTTIPLPLVIVATLLTGAVAAAPLLVVGLVVLNVLCAAIGQPYSPDA